MEGHGKIYRLILLFFQFEKMFYIGYIFRRRDIVLNSILIKKGILKGNQSGLKHIEYLTNLYTFIHENNLRNEAVMILTKVVELMDKKIGKKTSNKGKKLQ